MRVYLEARMVVDLPETLDNALQTGEAEPYAVLDDALMHGELTLHWLAVDYIEPTSQRETPEPGLSRVLPWRFPRVEWKIGTDRMLRRSLAASADSAQSAVGADFSRRQF